MRGAVSCIILGGCLAVFAAVDAFAGEILVTIAPQLYVTKRLMPGRESVAMIPRNVNFHSFEPSVEEFRRVGDAKVYLRLSHPDLPGEKLLKVDSAKVKVRDVTEGVESRKDDPHFWLSTVNFGRIAENSAKALGEIYPDEQQSISNNLQSLLREVATVRAALEEKFTPYRGRKFMAFHPAWGYLAGEFGLEQIAIERDGKEPDPFTLQAIIRSGRDAGVKKIFVEPLFSEAAAEEVAEELGATIDVLDPMAEDWPRNLGVVADKLAESFRQ